ncbi:alpha/beta hydrolase [Caldibacillus debilis]|uniref:alpha/beta hydrolase n=1 Tax=Caldibacillus debilis TaxID=301148 RepID=UPI003C6C2ACF
MAGKKMEQTGRRGGEVGIREVTIPGTEQRVMYSRDGKREYRIFLAKPDGDPPPSGFPVIYLLDANAVFGTMVEAVRVQARRPEKTGVFPAVVVGIGYPTEMPFAPARFYDFTLPVPAAELPPGPDGAAWPELGGAEAFLAFIEEELKPEIESELPIDSGRRTLFGHSLGGLFALHVLFTRPAAFRTYIAGSPSIHWNERPLREAERQFVSRLERETLNIDLLLAAGELEKSHPSRINANARELAERLSPLAGCGLHVEFKEFEGEGHVSVLPALISRAVRFASRR